MTEFNIALRTLKQNDPKLGEIIEVIKPQYNKKKEDTLTTLIKIIIGQQLSGSAAKTILSRVEDRLDKKTFNPKDIETISNEDLRSCGISNAKISYIKGLSQILLKEPTYFENLKQNNEEEILKQLCKIKGIGIWTASIFAMGSLHYDNIFPYGDVTLIKAIKNIYGENILIEDVISKWSPYKSFGCRILWQWVDKGMPN
jgi:DNA-3-methyladenine glycosylase II